MKIRMTFPDSMARRGRFTLNGRKVHIRKGAARLLELLLLRRGEWIGAEDLKRWLWPHPDNEPEWASRIILVYVHWLRRAGVEIENNLARAYRIKKENERG